ncbi:MAG: hypothetical protein HY532_03130 [Chloroflexi bacterium]|nr:hypothetical protein [Chloroflexota bacterium]
MLPKTYVQYTVTIHLHGGEMMQLRPDGDLSVTQAVDLVMKNIKKFGRKPDDVVRIILETPWS